MISQFRGHQQPPPKLSPACRAAVVLGQGEGVRHRGPREAPLPPGSDPRVPPPIHRPGAPLPCPRSGSEGRRRTSGPGPGTLVKILFFRLFSGLSFSPSLLCLGLFFLFCFGFARTQQNFLRSRIQVIEHFFFETAVFFFPAHVRPVHRL